MAAPSFPGASPSAWLCLSPYFVVQKHPRIEARRFGLYAVTALPAGFTFHEESPTFALQHAMNKSLVRACCHCQRVVGDAGVQLRHLFAAANPEALADFDCLPSDAFCGSLFSPVVLCPGGCGEVYCSDACQAAHMERSHRFLCVGPLSGSHPLVAFKRLCLDQTEILLLAAEAICAVVTHATENVCLPILRGGLQAPAVEGQGPSCGGPQQSQSDKLYSSAAETADRPQLMQRHQGQVRQILAAKAQEVRAEAERLFQVLLDYAHDRWELLGEEGEAAGDEGEPVEERTAVLDLARRQLFAAFSNGAGDAASEDETRSPAHQPGAPVVASFFQQSSELLSRIAGLLEKTNSHVVVASPLNAYFTGLLANTHARSRLSRDILAFLLREKEVAMLRALGEEDESDDEEDEMDMAAADRSRQRRHLLATRFADVPCEDLVPPDSSAAEGSKDPSSANCTRLRDIVQPHAFPDVHGTGFYPSIGRMNHSCAPNVRVEFPYGTNRISLVTTRPVEPGEELCISYVDGVESMTADERREALEIFGFQCSCDVCFTSR
ncbi:putative histone-lysine N-methyltransferase [Neospora caninum Liverpool]|uniref:Histone-lysine N-methyltransferase, putative n=1 Tax=Neospora caninum (strain Liverpool) TaxID=572307 RepID=F0VQD5_NEOCL|nr:putative histone-lysine N-methyltransferase [Neospora caninum Liverpool]CBZ55932.1 putative histone-lysine N-methyltransferase [Neospora caninum Liverpool]CEL70675.1 TPA: histone-lysine N-methyltransferase, putative [Neospora caninum Liverpool]|eukprot:XP_003885958.1 putative histone-lysine N-methyltransferase [Neospora caninum Liverpool]